MTKCELRVSSRCRYIVAHFQVDIIIICLKILFLSEHELNAACMFYGEAILSCLVQGVLIYVYLLI